MKTLTLTLVPVLLLACYNPLSDTTTCIVTADGTLDRVEPGYLLVADKYLVMYWPVPVHYPVVSVLVQLTDGRWVPASWSMNSDMTVVFVYGMEGMNGKYRIAMKR